SHISGAIDSYYEYLLKCWLLFGDRDCKRMWDNSIVAINKYLQDNWKGELWYGHADMNTGARGATTFGALDAFFPAVLALSGDLQRARRLQQSAFSMWWVARIEPEVFDYRARKITSPGYPLRPEIVESAYYLWRYTKDHRYRNMGAQLWFDFVQHCRTEVAYAALKDVTTKEKADSMQSFLFAETFKYFYLLFSPPNTLDINSVIFNTEAHPIKRFKPAPRATAVN
ncbi:MAG TPA: glycoside hydrolase family 47 protein, partial [Pyrinomonadaceae bacterium]|nr:glycoside hydrolase family 47 protein [Pyrinomonadaceae bacterium]